MMKKATIIKICILPVLLAVLTAVYARQDVTVRVTLSGETLVRAGQRLEASVFTDRGESYSIPADTPYYTIYEYEVKVPANVWPGASQIRMEFCQVRRDDHIYIESISVKQPFFNERIIDNSIVFDSISDVSSADVSITGGNLLDIEVLATRAHTSSMSTEGPSFSLPAEVIKAPGTLSYTYILSAIAAIAVWALAAFAVPAYVYAAVPVKLRELAGVIKSFSAMDAAIVILGAASLVFYFYGSRILSEYSEFPYNLFSVAAVMLIIIKVMNMERTVQYAIVPSAELSSKSRERDFAQGPAAPHPCSASNDNTEQSLTVLPKWMTYLLLLVLSAAVYIPAAFPNPYFSNDEFQVIGAAEHFLESGNYGEYDRAWPHTWLVAQAIRLFGLSTVSTRLLSAAFGILFILSAYYIIAKLSGRKNIAVLSAFLLLCTPGLISIFSTVRMYAVMLPLSLWMFYCAYMTLQCAQGLGRSNAVAGFGYGAATVLLVWLNYVIHINSMILLAAAFIYAVATGVINKQRKFINLAAIGAAAAVITVVIYFLNESRLVIIPVISQMSKSIVRIVMQFVGFGLNNYNYFWTNINTPLGSYLGILFLLLSFTMCLSAARKHKRLPVDEEERTGFMTYTAACYAIVVVFFVYFANRYYSYVYMAFLAPVTMMLVSAGYYELLRKVNAPTRAAVSMLIATALTLQMSSVFSTIYIDDPGETKYDRPLLILVNDAKNEQLDTVPVYATFTRRYFYDIVKNGERAGSMSVQSGEVYPLDRWVEWLDMEQPVKYFFSEQSKMWHTRGENGVFLETATDLITTIDASVLRKYYVVEASRAEDGFYTEKSGAVLNITDVSWDGDAAYVNCTMGFVPGFEGAVFIAVEMTEQGIAQSAAHRFQVFVPEDFNETDTLGFLLQVRPKTEEYRENITFNMSGRAYVYYGGNESAIVELTQ